MIKVTNAMELNHITNFSISEFTIFCSFSNDSSEINIFVSSAKRINQSSLDMLVISFMYKTKSSGPSIDPLGTPHNTFILDEELLL